jgi:hypothetical protein
VIDEKALLGAVKKFIDRKAVEVIARAAVAGLFRRPFRPMFGPWAR